MRIYLRRLMQSPPHQRGYGRRLLLCLIIVGVIRIVWQMGHSPKEREDIRPVMSWYDEQMQRLANEKRSNEEEMIFQRLAFDYERRLAPPEEGEVQHHRYQDSLPNCDGQQWKQEAAEAGRCPYRTETRFPILLWWSEITFHKQLIRRCTYGRCVFTQNRRELASPRTRAVLFGGQSLQPTDVPLPRKREVEWMMIHESAPHLAPLLYSPKVMGLFNVTATFSRHSDFPLTVQHLDELHKLEGQNVDLERKQAALREGIALVVYAVEDCDVPSDRDNLVRLLMDLLPVDFLGNCPELKESDPRNKWRKRLFGWDEMHAFADHKFSLVFESDICSDYISKALWQAIEWGTVPVYFGDAEHLKSLLPHPKAVIFVSDFPSLPDLVKYLKKLNASADLYKEHLWTAGKAENKDLKDLLSKRNYGDISSPLQNAVDGFECFACDKVYEQLLAKAYSKPMTTRVADESHFACREPQPYSHQAAYPWQERWAKGVHDGNALYKMVQSSNKSQVG